MIGKLLKNELRHSSRYILTIYAVVAAMAGILVISMMTSATWLGAICCFVLYVVGFAAFVVTLVSVIRNFYDTLFGRQGYITLTLPVKSSTLLISKVIVAFMWTVTGFVVMFLTYFIIFWYTKGKGDGVINMIIDAVSLSGLLDLLPSTSVMIQFAAVILAIVVLTVLSYVAMVFFTVTAVNIRPLQSHPKLYGGVLFLATFGVTNSLGNVFTSYFPLTVNITSEKVFFSLSKMGAVEEALVSYGLGGTIFSGIAAVVLLAVTCYLLEHKVNLK